MEIRAVRHNLCLAGLAGWKVISSADPKKRGSPNRPSVLSFAVQSHEKNAPTPLCHAFVPPQTSNDFHPIIIIISPSFAFSFSVLFLSTYDSSRQQAVNMMPSHLYPSSTLVNIIIVLVLLSAPNPAASQSIEAQIAALPACSTACLNKAATNILCGATDFVCQCANQEGILGVLGRVSSQASCLISDCGISNATSTFYSPVQSAMREY